MWYWIAYIGISFFMGALFFKIANNRIDAPACFTMGFFFPFIICMGLGLWAGEKLNGKIKF